jgi:LysR family glycine cleavage system transcriptional activator
VFESAARHGNFTKAAQELGMTQAAVSYQIKLLEERVGTPLFLRRPRQVLLTAAGQRLAPATTHALETLDAAFAGVKTDSDDVLAVNVVPTFASNWLVQRLGRFQMAHPAIAVRLSVSHSLVDFGREEVDVGIRSGDGTWPGLAAHLLLPADFTPMLSPRLAETIGGVATPADLMKLPLIGPDDPWWTVWFEAVSLPPVQPAASAVSRLGLQNLEGKAAIAGQGVAILTPAFFGEELASGQLIQPFEQVCHDGHGYFLVYSQARRLVPKIRAFRDWILSEVQAFHQEVTAPP